MRDVILTILFVVLCIIAVICIVGMAVQFYEFGRFLALIWLLVAA